MTTEEIKQGKPLSPTAQKVMNIASILGAIATVVFIVWAWQKGLFTSQETLSAYMLQAGIWGPPIFIFYKFYKPLFQSFQERSLVSLVFIFTVTGLETFITTSVL